MQILWVLALVLVEEALKLFIGRTLIEKPWIIPKASVFGMVELIYKTALLKQVAPEAPLYFIVLYGILVGFYGLIFHTVCILSYRKSDYSVFVLFFILHAINNITFDVFGPFSVNEIVLIRNLVFLPVFLVMLFILRKIQCASSFYEVHSVLRAK